MKKVTKIYQLLYDILVPYSGIYINTVNDPNRKDEGK